MSKNEMNDLGFSIEEIYLYDSHDRDNMEFGVRIIPDSNSKTFPPFHTRVVRVSPQLLSMNFYTAIREKNHDLPSFDQTDFAGSVIQGGYYKVTGRKIPTTTLITPESNEADFFKNRYDSPYFEVASDNVQDINILNEPGDQLGELFVYCFDVGQGDSFLIIFPNHNVYVIDTNIYSTNANKYINNVKSILKKHNLPEDKIKAIIFTHKHLDHIRGAAFLINQFSVKYFVINLDYSHPTKPVEDLFSIARNKIPVWINCNNEARILEGKTEICIRNPDEDTSSQVKAPDINDSSICLCIHHGDNQAYLTGDAGHLVISRKYDYDIVNTVLSRPIYENFLKVAHHGSNTGTNVQVLNTLMPSHCFISAGHSVKYNHPSPEVMDLLKSNKIFKNPKVIVSKTSKKTVQYKFDGNNIKYNPY